MLALFLALWAPICRWLHRGEHLAPAPVGGYRCARCGCAFRDWVDAGRYEEMSVSVPRLGMEEPARGFEPAVAIVRKGGVPVRVIRFSQHRRSA